MCHAISFPLLYNSNYLSKFLFSYFKESWNVIFTFRVPKSVLLHLYWRKYTLTIPVHILSVCKRRLMIPIILFTCCKPGFWHLQNVHIWKVTKLTATAVCNIKSQQEKRVHQRSHALATLQGKIITFVVSEEQVHLQQKGYAAKNHKPPIVNLNCTFHSPITCNT